MENPYIMPTASHLQPEPMAKPPSDTYSMNRSAHAKPALPSSPLEGGDAPANTSSTKWWKIMLFKGMANDTRRRTPFYWSDWKDAWDYRVVPATIYMYFAKQVLPIASQAMLPHTKMNDFLSLWSYPPPRPSKSLLFLNCLCSLSAVPQAIMPGLPTVVRSELAA